MPKNSSTAVYQREPDTQTLDSFAAVSQMDHSPCKKVKRLPYGVLEPQADLAVDRQKLQYTRNSSHQNGAPLTAILQERPSPSAVFVQGRQEGFHYCVAEHSETELTTCYLLGAEHHPQTIYYCVPESFDHHSDISCSS